MIKIDDNWIVPVLHDGPQNQILIDPAIKVTVRMTVPRMDPGEETRGLQVDYDPQMGADRMVVGMNRDEIAERFWRTVPNRPTKLFRSPAYQKDVADFLIFSVEHLQRSETNGDLILRLNAKSIRMNIAALAKAGIPVVSDAPADFLVHFLKAYFDLPAWDEYAAQVSANIGFILRRVTLVVPEAIAAEIGQETGEVLPAFSDSEYAVIASRQFATR